MSAPPMRAPWLHAARLVAVTRVVLLVVAWAAAWLLEGEQQRPDEGGLGMWARWDAQYYLALAERGYHDDVADGSAAAFFPLYPLGIRALAALGIPLVAAAMLLSAVATVVACAYLYRLAEEVAGEGSGRRAVIYLLLFPTAVFLVAPYSEALFLAGAVPAFFYARQGRWLPAGAAAAVAVATRTVGVFVLLGLALVLLVERPRSWRELGIGGAMLAAATTPLALYLLYLYRTTGDALAFLGAQRGGWGRELVGPVESFMRTWHTWSGDYPANSLLTWRLEILAAVVGVALVAWAASRGDWGFAGYMAGCLAVLVVSSWYQSIPRVLVTFFPASLYLAAVVSERWHDLVVVALAATAVLGVVVFTQGAWYF